MAVYNLCREVTYTEVKHQISKAEVAGNIINSNGIGLKDKSLSAATVSLLNL